MKLAGVWIGMNMPPDAGDERLACWAPALEAIPMGHQQVRETGQSQIPDDRSAARKFTGDHIFEISCCPAVLRMREPVCQKM